MNLSASSHLSINGLYGSSFETAAGRIGGSGEQSSICAYLRTVCLDTPTSFAMRRQDTPLASRTLIRCCMGVGTVMSFPSRDTCKWLPQLGNLTRPDGPTPLRADNTITWSTFHRQHGQQPRDKPVHKPLNKYNGRRELHIAIGFAAGSRFPCPEPGCGEAACPVHDARERVWRHLNFFQYKAFIHAGVPRVTCPAHGVHAVPVPWARPGSGFTLLFEAMVVELAKSQPVADIAEQVGEHDTRLWRFIRHYVDEARLYEDHTGVEAIGIDETSRKGHRYITVVADLVERNVICVVPGKDSTTIKRFARDFMDHNGDPDRVRLVTCDMSLGFAKGIRERLPNAARIIDKFHVIKHANEAVDKVRKQEARGNALLKRTKYLWLRNESNLTGLQLETKRSLQRQRLKTGRACQMRETLQDIYDTSADRAEAETALKRLCSWMTRSRLEPMKEFARQIRRHWRDILAYFDHPYTNAILEGLNSVIQNVKTRARGFKNMDYFSTMIYLTCGKLDLSTVTT